MSLRLQLVAALVLLAIVPLGAVTAWSYSAWKRSYTSVIESGAAELAERMGTQMEPVTRELARRIARFRDRPAPERSADQEQARREALDDAQRAETRQILLGVLAATPPQGDEIPFGVDAGGELFVSDPGQRVQVEALGGASLAGGAGQQSRVVGDWIVVTRHDAVSGLTLGIARPMDQAVAASRRTALENLAIGLGVLALALLGVQPLSKRMTRNLRSLTAGAERLASGDLQVRVPVRSKDEFGELARTFNQMAEDLAVHQVKLLAQERLHKELEMCRRIQQEFLPHGPLSLPFARLDGVSVPAREVGGDFYSYFERPAGDVAIVVGDVAGKGVPAALLMANTQASLRAKLIVTEDLAGLTDLLDHELEGTTLPFQYVTLFVGLFDGRSLRYVNAGHNPPMLLRADGSHECLSPTGRPVALLAGGGYEQHQVELAPGDSLVAFTDGVIEAEDRHGEPFGEARLRDELLKVRDRPSPEVLQRLQAAVRRHRGRAEAADDATLLLMSTTPAPAGA